MRVRVQKLAEHKLLQEILRSNSFVTLDKKKIVKKGE
jgi:hypothetical protein